MVLCVAASINDVCTARVCVEQYAPHINVSAGGGSKQELVICARDISVNVFVVFVNLLVMDGLLLLFDVIEGIITFIFFLFICVLHVNASLANVGVNGLFVVGEFIGNDVYCFCAEH